MHMHGGRIFKAMLKEGITEVNGTRGGKVSSYMVISNCMQNIYQLVYILS